MPNQGSKNPRVYSGSIKSTTGVCRSGIVVQVIRTAADYQRFLDNHARDAHRGEVLEACPACQELTHSIEAALSREIPVGDF